MPGPRGVWWRSHWFRRAPTASRQPQAAGWTAGRYGIGSIATTRKVLRGLPGAGAWSTPRRGAEGRACHARPRRPRSGNARCCRLAACRSATRDRKALGCDDAGTHGRQAACRARVSAPFGAPARNPTRRPGRRLKALPPRYRPTCPMRCAARKSRCGSGTKRVSAGRAPRDTGYEWTRIFGARRLSRTRRDRRAGTAQGRCAFPITSRSCRCRPTLHRSTLSKTSGPACAPTRTPPSVFNHNTRLYK